MALAVSLPVVFLVVSVVVLSIDRSGGTTNVIADYVAPPVPVDRIAPGFTLPSLGRRGTISLGDLTGHPVVLIFWASWCPPCREEAPFLRTVWSTYRPQGVRFLGVDHRDARPAGLSFIQRTAMPYPSVYDVGGVLARRYGLFGIPTTLVLRADGRIAYQITGRVDGTNLESALNKLAGSG
jgi:cytochrome c biogenesis protein CcmG/thiol:disulfide interchange protein DsbE